MDRKIFFDAVRKTLFGGKLTQVQVSGMDAILFEGAQRKLPLPFIAYILATVKWETANTFRADIREFGRGKGRKYGKGVAVLPGLVRVFYGRGWPQLTWDFNYQKMGRKIGVDLYERPDLALELTHTRNITFTGMIDGDFTGKKLADYLAGPTPSFVNARRVVNGTDRASTIAGYADKFLLGLLAANDLGYTPAAPKPVKPVNPDTIKDGAGVGTTTGGGGTTVSPAGADPAVFWGGLVIGLLGLAYLAWRFRKPLSIHLSLLVDGFRRSANKL